MFKKLFFISILFFLVASSVQAAANRFIPFQARLTDGDGIVLNGVYKLIFIIYDEPTGGTAMWTEEHQDVSVLNGMVNVILGTKTNLDDPGGDGSNQSIYFTNNRYLGITVGTASNQEMVPRHQIVPSFQSKIADRAFEADNAARLNNQLPEYYATKASVDDLNNRLFAAVPPGTVLTYAGSTVPAGFLECNGQEYPISTYPELHAAIGDTYGGTVPNFKVPDYRGYFLRGWDHGAGNDSDANSRTDSGNGTIGDNVGTKQTDSNKMHNHPFVTGNESQPHDHNNQAINFSYPNYATAQVDPVNQHYIYIPDTGWTNHLPSYDGNTSTNQQNHTHSGTTDNSGAIEAKPKNIYVMYIIKY